MAGADADYMWLRHPDSPVAVAGCIAVVSAAPIDKAAAIFGVDWQAPAVNAGALELDASLSASFAQLTAGCVVIENDGFQGSRSDVLASLSRVSEKGRAAAVFWNVNDLVIFSCAQRGRVVAVVDVGTRDNLSRLPAALRRLLTVASEESDPVAIGAKMVEQFTGVRFSNADLLKARRFLINPPPPSGDPDELEYTPLYDDEPQLVERIARLPAGEQRKLAEWTATALIETADLQTEPALQAIVTNFGKQSPAIVPPESSAWFARMEREREEEERQQDDEDDDLSIQLRRLYQLHWTINAVEYACHPDAQTAAWRTAYAASLALANAQMIGSSLSVDEFKGLLESRLS